MHPVRRGPLPAALVLLVLLGLLAACTATDPRREDEPALPTPTAVAADRGLDLEFMTPIHASEFEASIQDGLDT